MVGSTNIDYLSLLRNRESNLMITDEQAINAVNRHFVESLASSEQLRPDFFERKPLYAKTIGYLGRPLKKIM